MGESLYQLIDTDTDINLMQNYTFFPLLGILSAKLDRVFSSLVELLEIATANYIFSAQTQQKGDRSPERGSGRREFHLLQAF